MERFYVDRMEGKIAVCVDDEKKIVEIELTEVKGKVVEGSVLIKKNGNFAVDEAETRLKRAEISQLQNELFGDD